MSIKQTDPVYPHGFALRGQDEIDWQTCRAKFRPIDIVRIGIQECLKQCLKTPKEAIRRAKDLI